MVMYGVAVSLAKPPATCHTHLMSKTFVGICPACNDVVVVPQKLIYFSCPHCTGKGISSQSRGILESYCADPARTRELLDLCLSTDNEYGAEIPLFILETLANFHPYNEEIAFTRIKVSGWNPALVHAYLKTFAPARSIVPFASEFLNHVLQPRYVTLAPLIAQYIESKLPAQNQAKYKKQLTELKSNYVGVSSSGEGMKLMYAFYIAGALVNVAMVVFAVIISWHIAILVFMVLAIFGAEMLLLYLHYKNYGNRLEISQRERLFMVIFMCSLVLALGGTIIGAFV